MVVKIITIAQEFLENLDKTTSSKIYEDIDLLRQFGKNLGLPHSKKIADSLYELRTMSKISIRLLYYFEDNICYVVHGFIKKTNKIPTKEIKTAKLRIKQLALR